jgi:hypothetical protein
VDVKIKKRTNMKYEIFDLFKTCHAKQRRKGQIGANLNNEEATSSAIFFSDLLLFLRLSFSSCLLLPSPSSAWVVSRIKLGFFFHDWCLLNRKPILKELNGTVIIWVKYFRTGFYKIITSNDKSIIYKMELAPIL